MHWLLWQYLVQLPLTSVNFLSSPCILNHLIELSTSLVLTQTQPAQKSWPSLPSSFFLKGIPHLWKSYFHDNLRRNSQYKLYWPSWCCLLFRKDSNKLQRRWREKVERETTGTPLDWSRVGNERRGGSPKVINKEKCQQVQQSTRNGCPSKQMYRVDRLFRQR